MHHVKDALEQLCFRIKDLVEDLAPDVKVDGVGLNIMRYDALSNSMFSPKSGVLNPSRAHNKPLHYPGWEGILFLRTNTKLPWSATKEMPSVGINVSGGGASIRSNPWHTVQNAVFHTSYKKPIFGRASRDVIEVYQYHVKLFADDFADIWKQYEQALILENLTSNYYRTNMSEFVYTSTNAKAKDSEILQKYARLKTITRI